VRTSLQTEPWETATLPALATGTVHVWVFSLDRRIADPERFRSLLNQQENLRLQQFRFETDRARYAVCRGLLRSLLGRYLGYPPEAVPFTYGKHNKPELEASRVRFNLAHTMDAVAMAFAQDSEVGIDIERLRTDNATDMLHILSPTENLLYQALPESYRSRYLLQLWVRKEAALKADGCGLLPSPNTMDASEPLVDWPGTSDVWRIADLDVGSAHCAAVCAQGASCNVITAHSDLQSATLD
jgi:4'-phosphopantetheinyl transferase